MMTWVPACPQAALEQVQHAAGKSDGGGPALDQALLAFLRVLQPETPAVHRLQVDSVHTVLLRKFIHAVFFISMQSLGNLNARSRRHMEGG